MDWKKRLELDPFSALLEAIAIVMTLLSTQICMSGKQTTLI